MQQNYHTMYNFSILAVAFDMGQACTNSYKFSSLNKEQTLGKNLNTFIKEGRTETSRPSSHVNSHKGR
jgi:hypothetical protein